MCLKCYTPVFSYDGYYFFLLIFVLYNLYVNENRKIVSFLSQFFSSVGAYFADDQRVVRVRQGERAVLECDPGGDQPIRVKWSRHNTLISPLDQNYFKVN